MTTRLAPKSLRAAAAGLVLLALAACDDAPPQAPPPTEVVVETVTRRDLPLTLVYPARVAGSRVVEVRARISGQIVERAYAEGQPVAAGDLLFRLDPKPWRAVVDQAAAQVALRRAAIGEAESEHRRVEALVEEGAVSRREFEQATSTLAQARAGLAAAEAALRAAQLDLGYTEVRAPIAGIASKEAVTVGNLVQGGGGAGGDLLTSIVQPDPAYVEFSAPEPEYLRLRDQAALSADGLTARIVGGSSCKRTGKVDFTDSFVNTTTGTVRARASFENADGCLVSGQFVSAEIAGLTLPRSIAIDKKAVLFTDRGAMAWVVGDDDTVSPRPLTLDGSWNDSWLVASGLEGGERVIVSGILKVQPGATVAPLTHDELAAREQAAGQAAAGEAAQEPPQP